MVTAIPDIEINTVAIARQWLSATAISATTVVFTIAITTIPMVPTEVALACRLILRGRTPSGYHMPSRALGSQPCRTGADGRKRDIESAGQ